MKSFYEFYQKMNELGTPGINAGAQAPQMAPTPQPGAQGTSPPVPPPDPNMLNGMKMLQQVKDPKFAGVFQKFMNQLQGLGISLPAQQYNHAPQSNPNPMNQAAQPQPNQPAQQ